MDECQDLLDANGVPVHLNTEIVRVEHQGTFIAEIIAKQGGNIFELTGDHFINSMLISTLVHRLDPPPPPEVLKAARGLRYRDFPIVSLVIDQPDLFPDHWLYIHSPEFKVGRIQNFKDWNPARVTDAAKTCLGVEYFCSEGDVLWEMADSALIELASQEIVRLNLSVRLGDIEDGCVIRQYKAYPVYDGEYRGHLQVLQDYIETFENLQTVGRNGMHRYNNQDHFMMTASLAAKNTLGEHHSLWDVNVEKAYHENFTDTEWSNLKQQQTSTQGVDPQLFNPMIQAIGK